MPARRIPSLRVKFMRAFYSFLSFDVEDKKLFNDILNGFPLQEVQCFDSVSGGYDYPNRTTQLSPSAGRSGRDAQPNDGTVIFALF